MKTTIAILTVLLSTAPAVAQATGIRAAVADLTNTFPQQYTGWLEKVDALEAKLSAAPQAQQAAIRKQLQELGRKALLANPLVSDRPIVFVVRRQFRRDHHNTATMFQNGEINAGSFAPPGALKLLDVQSGKVTTLVDAGKGVARDPDVSFDAKRIVFSMRKNKADDYHIYQVSADGSGLTQLTFGKHLSDIDPVSLPDGRIAFTSTREPKFCMCNRHIMGNVWVMAADGANPIQIGHSTLHEGHGTITSDGRILYDRWEYVDRNFGDAQGLWTCNPDGTNHAIYWGNNTASPGAVIDAREIPGSAGNRVIAVLGSCHDRPWGALGIIDRRLGIDGRKPVIRTWPAAAIHRVTAKGFPRWDDMTHVRGRYEDPWPLSARYFLASKLTGPNEQMSLVLLDVFGNETMLHTEAPGCFDPIPLAARPRPPVIPSRVDLARKTGTFYIYDVYQGTGMERVKRGAVKSLRVVESPEKRHWTHPAWGGQGSESPAMAWHDFNNKRILGTVPVEPDGSAHFEVPADRFVYFQLLDEKGMMIQSMRSGTLVRPGERAGCVGCHENRLESVPNNTKAAMRRRPSTLQDWHGPARKFSYLVEVQPALDKHCVRCHDYAKPAGRKLNLSGGQTAAFNVSYMELWHKGYVGAIGAGPPRVQRPYSWGSHASGTIKALADANHTDVTLDPESFDRLVTWIDINGPYYPEYASAYRNNAYGRSPLTHQELGTIQKLTGARRNGRIPYVDLGRPEKSPCLAGFKDTHDPKYTQALAIIRTAAARLKARPRAEMPDFKYVDEAARRQKVYEQFLRQETEARKAILDGRKIYPFAPAGKGN